jgi:hypothetical protein
MQDRTYMSNVIMFTNQQLTSFDQAVDEDAN